MSTWICMKLRCCVACDSYVCYVEGLEIKSRRLTEAKVSAPSQTLRCQANHKFAEPQTCSITTLHLLYPHATTTQLACTQVPSRFARPTCSNGTSRLSSLRRPAIMNLPVAETPCTTRFTSMRFTTISFHPLYDQDKALSHCACLSPPPSSKSECSQQTRSQHHDAFRAAGLTHGK